MFSLFDNNTIPGTGQQLIGTGGSIPPSPVRSPIAPKAAKPSGTYDKDRAFLKKLKDMGYDANQAYQALQDVKAGKQPSLGQSQQAATETAKPEQTGFLADVRKSAAERAKNAAEIQGVEQTGAERFLQEAGQGAGFLGDVAFAGLKAATPEFVKSGLKATGKAAAEALPDFIKNAGIEAAKGGAESYAAWREKHPRSALNLEATVNIGSIIPIGKGAQVAKQGVGAAVESTAKAAAKSTVGLRSEIAQSLRKSAIGDVSQALAPTKKEMKLITEKIAPEFINKGIVGSRETILNKATEGMESFGKQIETYIDSGKLVGDVPRSSIDSAIDSFAAGAKSKAGIVIDEEKLLLADKMRSLTAKFGESIPADEAKSVLKVLGGMTARKKGFTTGAEKLSAELERGVYGSIARELAKANPELDKLNKAFSFYKNLHDVTQETISRVAPQSGMLRKAAATLFAGGGQGQGVIDTAIRYVGSKVFLDFVSSPFYSTVKSRVKTALADAIYNGNTKVADDIIRTVKAGKTVNPVILSKAAKAPKPGISQNANSETFRHIKDYESKASSSGPATKYTGRIEFRDGHLNYHIRGDKMTIAWLESGTPRKGTGTAILKEAERVARNNGVKEIRLFADSIDPSIISQKELNSFYEKNGFINESGNIGPGMMSKQLNNQSMLGTAASESVPTVKSKFAPETKWKSENKTPLSQEIIDALDKNGIGTAKVTNKAALRTMPGIKQAEKAINADKDFKEAYGRFKTTAEKAEFAKLVNYVSENEGKILEEYRKGYGNVVNTDEFRTFLGGQRGVLANTNHEIASKLAKKYLAQLLEENKGQGKKFIILAGGGGSGKGATQKAFAMSNPDAVILDGTYANLNTGLKNLRTATEMGFKPEVAFTMRNFESALDGIAERAVNMGRRGLVPRTVPFSEASKAHALARKNVLATYDDAIKEFADGKVSFWDNTGKMEDFKQIDRAQVAKLMDANPIPAEIPDWYVSKINDLVKSGKLDKALGKNLMSAAAFATVIAAMLGTGQAQGTQG